jgi:hypothetical protein
VNSPSTDREQLQTGLTRADIIFPTVAIVLILICSFLLARQLFGVGGAGETEIVGEIYYKDKVAERKFAKQALWGGLKNGSPVYNYDTIRTETAAEAVIELKDGTRIEMDQNTMIVIVVTDDAAEIDFARGGIRTVRDDGGAGGLSIKSDQGTVDLSSGDVALSKDEGEDLTVTLKKGEASVSADGRTEALGENQQAQVGESMDLSSLIELVAPAANARAFVKGGAVSFRWGAAGGPVEFELAADRGFTKGLRRSTVAANQIRLTLDSRRRHLLLARASGGRAAAAEKRSASTDRGAGATAATLRPGGRDECARFRRHGSGEFFLGRRAFRQRLSPAARSSAGFKRRAGDGDPDDQPAAATGAGRVLLESRHE